MVWLNFQRDFSAYFNIKFIEFVMLSRRHSSVKVFTFNYVDKFKGRQKNLYTTKFTRFLIGWGNCKRKRKISPDDVMRKTHSYVIEAFIVSEVKAPLFRCNIYFIKNTQNLSRKRWRLILFGRCLISIISKINEAQKKSASLKRFDNRSSIDDQQKFQVCLRSRWNSFHSSWRRSHVIKYAWAKIMIE